MMKFKCIVEYEYPIEHKPPVKADIYLHGDKVTTREITPIKTGYWINIPEEFLKGNVLFKRCSNCNFVVHHSHIRYLKYCPNCGAEMGDAE